MGSWGAKSTRRNWGDVGEQERSINGKNGEEKVKCVDLKKINGGATRRRRSFRLTGKRKTGGKRKTRRRKRRRTRKRIMRKRRKKNTYKRKARKK